MVIVARKELRRSLQCDEASIDNVALRNTRENGRRIEVLRFRVLLLVGSVMLILCSMALRKLPLRPSSRRRRGIMRCRRCSFPIISRRRCSSCLRRRPRRSPNIPPSHIHRPRLINMRPTRNHRRRTRTPSRRSRPRLQTRCQRINLLLQLRNSAIRLLLPLPCRHRHDTIPPRLATPLTRALVIGIRLAADLQPATRLAGARPLGIDALVAIVVLCRAKAQGRRIGCVGAVGSRVGVEELVRRGLGG